MCNVVVLIEKFENCQNYRILKSNLPGLSAFPTQCALLSMLFLKDYSSDRFQILHNDSTDIEDVQRHSFSRNKTVQGQCPADSYAILFLYIQHLMAPNGV